MSTSSTRVGQTKAVVVAQNSEFTRKASAPAVEKKPLLTRKYEGILKDVEIISAVNEHIDSLLKVTPADKHEIIRNLKKDLTRTTYEVLEGSIIDFVQHVESLTGVSTRVVQAQCPFCLQVVSDPNVLVNCGHLICGGCLRESDAQIRCPNCRVRSSYTKVYI